MSDMFSTGSGLFSPIICPSVFCPLGLFPFTWSPSTLQTFPSDCWILWTLLSVNIPFTSHFHITSVIYYYLRDCQNRFMTCASLSALFVVIRFINCSKPSSEICLLTVLFIHCLSSTIAIMMTTWSERRMERDLNIITYIWHRRVS